MQKQRSVKLKGFKAVLVILAFLSCGWVSSTTTPTPIASSDVLPASADTHSVGLTDDYWKNGYFAYLKMSHRIGDSFTNIPSFGTIYVSTDKNLHYVKDNGSDSTIGGSSGGGTGTINDGTAKQVAVYSGISTVSGYSGFQYDNSTQGATTVGPMIAGGSVSRVTFTATGDYVDGTSDDVVTVVGRNGTFDTDLRVSLDDAVGPIIDSVSSNTMIVNDALQLGRNGNDGSLVFYNELGATDRTNTIALSGTQAANITYTLPPTDGNAAEFLQTDGSGVLTWVPISGVTAASGDVVAVGDCTGGSCFVTGGSGTTLTLPSDYFTISGTEDMKVSTATANQLIYSSSTGVTGITIPWTVTLQNAETIANTTNGTFTLAADNGQAEDLSLDLSSTSNKGKYTSSTGLNALDYFSGAVTISSASASQNVDAAGTNSGQAIRGIKTLSSGGDATTGGVLGRAVKSLAGGSNIIYGVNGDAQFTNTATTVQTNSYGVLGQGSKSGKPSTITNFYGIYGQAATITQGTIRNNYAAGFEGKVKAAGTAPSFISCGTGPAITGGSWAGKITVGTGGVTTCSVSLDTAYAAPPAAFVSGQFASKDYSVVTTSSDVTITTTADMSSETLSYMIIGL